MSDAAYLQSSVRARGRLSPPGWPSRVFAIVRPHWHTSWKTQPFLEGTNPHHVPQAQRLRLACDLHQQRRIRPPDFSPRHPKERGIGLEAGISTRWINDAMTPPHGSGGV